MRAFWVILLGGLALVGTAEARLGESLKEIEDRYGKLISTSSLSDKTLQETHNEENMEKNHRTCGSYGQ